MKPAPARIALVVALAGCGGMQIQGPPSPLPGTGDSPGFGGGGAVPRGGNASPGSATDQICRNSAVRRGWIAIDYMPVESCPPLGSRGELGPNGALLVRHQDMPPETFLTVCNDQRVPPNWTRDADPASDGTASRCPRRPGDTRTGATTMRIRRVR